MKKTKKNLAARREADAYIKEKKRGRDQEAADETTDGKKKKV